jgi:thimet oligopeptidase
VALNNKFLFFSFLFFLPGCFMFTGAESLFREDGFVKTIEDLNNFFPKSVSQINAYAKRAIESAKKSVEAIIKIDDDKRTFENTALAFDEAGRRFSIEATRIATVGYVYPEAAMRDSSNSNLVEMHKKAVETFASKEIYGAFKSYIESGKPKEENLSEEESYFLKKEMEAFLRQGFQLPDIDFKEVQSLKAEISKLENAFAQNIAAASSDKFPLNLDKLDGVSSGIISALKKDENGDLLVGLDYPTYLEVMGHCKVRETRKFLNKKFQNRAFPANKTLLEEMVELRAKLADKLGYSSFSSYDSEDQMAQSPKVVEKFFEDLAKKVKSGAIAQHKKFIADLPDNVELNEDGKFFPWDRSFALKAYTKKHFDVDDREIAEYFPLEHTLDQVFKIYQEFLGLKFEFVDGVKAWHEDAKLISIRDGKNGRFLGHLFLDLHPRPFKYSHACFEQISPSVDRVRAVEGFEEKELPFLAVVIANFPKGTGEKPSLLKHDDVVTFFHEFGHAMHGLLGRTAMAGFSGTNVLNDFVETPSQMFEEWMWNSQALKKVSKHYKTGEPIPDDLLNKMLELRASDMGSHVQRQIALSLFSLRLFGPEKHEINTLFEQLYEEVVFSAAFDKESNFAAAFGHLSNPGYVSKYYGYMWTKVFALDLFDNVRNSQASILEDGKGAHRVRALLSAGGSVDPNKLLKEFLGRGPSQKAFLKELGFA